MSDRSTAVADPQAIAAPAAPYRPSRARRALQWLVTSYLVIGSMVITGYQTWRIHELLLGDASIVGGVAITAFYAVTPTVLVGQLASRWIGRGTDWVGVALLAVLAFVYLSANMQWLAAHGVERPWAGGLAFVFLAAIGPWAGTLYERYRGARRPARPCSGVDTRPELTGDAAAPHPRWWCSVKTLYSLAMLISIFMVGWYTQIPSFLRTVGWSPPSYFVTEPQPNVSLAWLAAAVIFGTLYVRKVRADSRSARDIGAPDQDR